MNKKHYMIRPWQADYKDNPNSLDLKFPPKMIYKYVNFIRARDIIKNNQLWFSCPSNFNDPFDMYHGLIDFSLNKSRAKIFANTVRNNAPRDIKRGYVKDLLKRKDEVIRYATLSFEEDKNRCGVCCFSESSDIALMWSHYADSHKGIVLGFNIDPVYIGLGLGNSTNDPFFLIQHVNYMNKVEQLNFYDYKEKALIHWVTTKSGIWSYEKEIRAFSRNSNGLLDYDPACLKEIHFGCKTTQDNIVELTKDIPTNIQLYKKVINLKRFDIDSVKLQ